MIEVLDISPAVGIIPGDEGLQFDIRTETANEFVRIIVAIFYPGTNIVEVAYAQNPTFGPSFEPFFLAASSIGVVADAGFQRYQFVIRRQASTGQLVWHDSPQLRIYAFNDIGEEL